MRWGSLLFSAEGRVGQRDFWIGAAVLFTGGLLAHAIPMVGGVAWLVSFYGWICLYAKRLHDMGRSAWIQLAPVVLAWALMSTGMGMGLGAILALTLTPAHFGTALALGFGALSLATCLFTLGGMVHIVMLLWLGVSPGQIGPNRYGPEAQALGGV